MRRYDKYDQIIADNVYLQRCVAGLSRVDIAKRLGVSHQQFSKYEKGENRLSAGTLIKLAEILSCDIRKFFVVNEQYVAIFPRAKSKAWKMMEGFSKLNSAKKELVMSIVEELEKL